MELHYHEFSGKENINEFFFSVTIQLLSLV